MAEISRQPRMDQIYSEKLKKLTGIPQGRWMMGSNHPELGGGFVFSLGHLSEKKTCVLINKNGLYLWYNTGDDKTSFWLAAKPKEIRAWSEKVLEATKSKLHEPTDGEIIAAMFNH